MFATIKMTPPSLSDLPLANGSYSAAEVRSYRHGPPIKKIPVANGSYSIQDVHGPTANSFDPKMEGEVVKSLGRGAFGSVVGYMRQGIAKKTMHHRDTFEADKERDTNDRIARLLTPETLDLYTALMPTAAAATNKSRFATTVLTRVCANGDNLTRVIQILNKSQEYKGFSRRAVFWMVAKACVHVLDELSGIINHCDIKPDNILICERRDMAGSYVARVIDFGASSEAFCKSGTPMFMPGRYDAECERLFLKMYQLRASEVIDASRRASRRTSRRTSTRAFAPVPDKYALGLTLACILGPKIRDDKGCYDLCCALTHDAFPGWSDYVAHVDKKYAGSLVPPPKRPNPGMIGLFTSKRVHPQAGGTNKLLARPRPPSVWQHTDKKTPGGRALWRNKVDGRLCVRTMVSVKGKRTAFYADAASKNA